MKQTTLPLWNSNNPVTYTELRCLCSQRYVQKSEQLIKTVETCLAAYDEAEDTNTAICVLEALEECVLELSCLNPAWNELSCIVFEASAFLDNPTTRWVKRRIRSIARMTLAGLNDGGAGNRKNH